MIQLPKLRKKTNKPKILLISDDIKYSSGVGTIGREIVFWTSNQFDWVQIAAGSNNDRL